MCLSIFFLEAFKISSLFIINNLIMLGLGVIFSGLLCLGSLNFSDLWFYCFHQI